MSETSPRPRFENPLDRLAPIVLLAVAAAFVMLGAYFYSFHGDLSKDQQVWGTFGDFVGGTLNPIIGLLSLVAIVRSLHYQSKQITLAIEQNREQQAAQTKQADIASKASQAQTYFLVIESINSAQNDDQVRALNRLLTEDGFFMKDHASWPAAATELARHISNRYQIVSHLIERDFLAKSIFFENFSGTVVHAWNLCAPYIAYRRSCFTPSNYLRRDFERLALQCWIYQCEEGFIADIFYISDDFALQHLSPAQGRGLALERILTMTRDSGQSVERRIATYALGTQQPNE